MDGRNKKQQKFGWMDGQIIRQMQVNEQMKDLQCTCKLNGRRTDESMDGQTDRQMRD